MDIARWLQRQKELQNRFGFPVDPGTGKEQAALLYAYSVGAIKELSEVMDEFSWKPWASDSFVNRGPVLSEIVDTQFFLLNMLLTIGVTEAEFEAAMLAKFDKNMRRSGDGYTHDYMKCKGCKRALDDFHSPDKIALDSIELCPNCSETL